MAVRLMAQIQQHFGLNLPLATLFQSPTIEQLATRLAEPSKAIDWSSLVPIRASGDKPPFFCVPGAGGNVMYLYDLARFMAAEQPFYGLQSVGLDGETEPYTTVEETAAHYIKAIQSVQPQGPYLLGGHSLGGEIIFEMAQQLARSGHEVSHLMIFDTSAPLPRPEAEEAAWDDAKWWVDFAHEIGEWVGQTSELDYDSLLLLDRKEQLIRFNQELKIFDFLPVDFDLNQLLGWVQVYKANMLMNYMPQEVIPTRITFFRAEEEDISNDDMDEAEKQQRQKPEFGWNQFSDEPVEVISVPGNHATMMKSPHIQALAEQLDACLERAVKRMSPT